MARNPFAGVRVELSPSTDLWMRGARFGTIRKVDQNSQIAMVKMDHHQVKRLQAVHVKHLTVRNSHVVGNSEYPIESGTRFYVVYVNADRIQTTPDVVSAQGMVRGNLECARVLWLYPDDLEQLPEPSER